MLSLVAAMVLGILMALPGDRWGAWRPVFYHLLMFGWATQMIFGVAWWMFPRRTPAEPQTTPLSWACFLALNAGLLLRVIAEPGSALSTQPAFRTALHASAVLQLLAVALFVMTMWRRVFAR